MLFDDPITTRALVAAVLLGAVCGPLGVWILLFRQVYAAESLAHAMLPGLVIAALAGVPLALGSAGGVLVAAALVGLAARDARVGPDVAVGVTIAGLTGVGALLALAPDVPARIDTLLFGDLLGLRWGEVALLGGVGLVLVAALAAAGRRLAIAAFDPIAAPSLGAPPGRATLIVLVVLAGALATAVPVLGNLLVVALLVAPAAAALRLASRLGPALVLAAVLAAAAAAAGVVASYELETAAGASVALAAVVLWALVALARPGERRGVQARSPIEAVGGT